MNTQVINILTDSPYGGNKGISTFQIRDGHLIIRGTFSKEDMQEILEIMDGSRVTHSKHHGVSDCW